MKTKHPGVKPRKVAAAMRRDLVVVVQSKIVSFEKSLGIRFLSCIHTDNSTVQYSTVQYISLTFQPADSRLVEGADWDIRNGIFHFASTDATTATSQSPPW